ncbi:hypothetical protein SAMN05518672_103595 [Chitinophaga sp. CF118]|uniref:hypothetical protein n=1 Tax=Chitinophaga sp. CF118 TaxID=1884367 RepID=UPI0008E9A570|nr:hypothetical protein [Chitinophaga sp. CF118]SFD86759.1 hypothetical protein SAMN05518672_103595 [Chitinophaga sp. CF118]
MPTIIIPINLDGLILANHTVVKDGIADYSLLPFTDKSNDHNPDTPYLSEFILNHPFQDKNLMLAPGVHLHWTLPTALSKTMGIRVIRKSDLDSLQSYISNGAWISAQDLIWTTILIGSGWIKLLSTADTGSILGKEAVDQTIFDEGINRLKSLLANIGDAPLFVEELFRIMNKPLGSDFPTVPDIWFVKRNNAGKTEKTWIVESSYIATTQTASNNNLSSVNVPFHDDRSSNKSQPFRYMGRRFEGDQKWFSGTRSRESYLKEITAVGYNPQAGSKGFAEPTFAAFYPNCLSVFGFYDAEITTVQGNISYEVLGLYADPGNDYLKTFLNDFDNRNADDEHYFEKLNNALNDEFYYSVSADNPLNNKDSIPETSVLFGKTIPKLPRSLDPLQVKVAVGNTGTEALSAYLSSKLTGNKKEIEEVLEATQFSSRLQNKVLDVGHKFQETRHAKGFTAFNAGNIWNIKLESIVSQAATTHNDTSEQEFTLPDSLAVLLNEANMLQSSYDKVNPTLSGLRSQLYADWYKYMTCAYPPVDKKADFFDLDLLVDYIRNESILPLQEQLQLQGTIKITKDAKGRLKSVDFAGHPGSTADQLAGKLNQLAEAVDVLNNTKGNDGKSLTEKGKCLAIRQVASPRFWRANDPAILFIEENADNEAMLIDDRYTMPDGVDTIECRISQNNLLDPANFSFNEAMSLFNLVSGLFITLKETGNANSLSIWNPFMMEWAVEYLPAFPGSNEQTDTRLYDDQYINQHYQLEETSPDFSLTSDRSVFNNANLYSGSTILTPHAGIRLDEAIKEFISSFGITQSEETLETLNAASALLQNANVLSQSLAGFHEALILKKQTRQLDVADPLGFPEYVTFTQDEVAPLVGKFNRTAPDTQGDFNPIRCGLLKLLNLRLIDSYGQTLEFVAPATVNSEMVNLDEAPETIHLKPRLSQPARLNFRFLSAGSDQQEMNVHPASSAICGWLLPNNLDQSLMFYDQDGSALGALTMDINNPWKPAPDSTATAFIDTIANLHLRKVARQLFELQMEDISETGTSDNVFLKHFLMAMNNALETIEPENFSEHQDLAILMGRPVAVVRAKLGIELHGSPAVDQSWTQLAHELDGQGRSADGFTRIKFPIRLGEYQQLNDGLLGYWIEQQNGSLGDDYFSSEAGDNPDPHIHTYTVGKQASNIYMAIDDEPLCVTMLVDPLGSIHISSGILPVKSVSIPKDQYRNALKHIAITFLTAPILSLENHFKLSLPGEPGYDWTWLEKDVTMRWQEIPQTVVISRSLFDSKFSDLPALWLQLVNNKWLQPFTDDPDKAWVTSAIQRSYPPSASVPAAAFPTDVVKRLDNFFDSYALRIEPFEMNANFGGPQVIREGWLQLRAINNTVDDNNQATV